MRRADCGCPCDECPEGRGLWEDFLSKWVTYQADRSLLTLGPMRRALEKWMEHVFHE